MSGKGLSFFGRVGDVRPDVMPLELLALARLAEHWAKGELDEAGRIQNVMAKTVAMRKAVLTGSDPGARLRRERLAHEVIADELPAFERWAAGVVALAKEREAGDTPSAKEVLARPLSYKLGPEFNPSTVYRSLPLGQAALEVFKGRLAGRSSVGTSLTDDDRLARLGLALRLTGGRTVTRKQIESIEKEVYRATEEEGYRGRKATQLQEYLASSLLDCALAKQRLVLYFINICRVHAARPTGVPEASV